MRPQFVTNAPEEYDGFSTRTVRWLEHPIGWRLIELHDEDVTWQRNRYGSGLYGMLTWDQYHRAYPQPQSLPRT